MLSKSAAQAVAAAFTLTLCVAAATAKPVLGYSPAILLDGRRARCRIPMSALA